MAILVNEDRLRNLLKAHFRRRDGDPEEFAATVEEIIKECKKTVDKP